MPGNVGCCYVDDGDKLCLLATIVCGAVGYLQHLSHLVAQEQ